MGISEEKELLRTRYRRERNERYIGHTFEHLVNLPEIAAASSVASYVSYGYEPDTTALNLQLIALGKSLLLPRISGDQLEWVNWNGTTETLHPKKKIYEPIGEAAKDLEKTKVIIVPALRIDRDGFRLGQGGGYYDRALPTFNAWSIGLIHPDEISSAELPRQPWDIPLSAAATPDLVLRFSR
jgi:5-formyltetrahydrofolate cyclo-ligase